MSSSCWASSRFGFARLGACRACDLCGMGRHLIPEVADALKGQGLLDKDAEFASVDELLDGLERTSSRAASTLNTPPLDVAGLRREWAGIREAAGALQPASLPSRETIGRLWLDLKSESEKQNRSVFETSSMMAVSAVRSVPDGLRWLAASTKVGAKRTGQVFAATLLDHYRDALHEMQRTGYGPYVVQQLRPYVRAATGQFSPKRQTLTERLIEKATTRKQGREPVRICTFSGCGGTMRFHPRQQEAAGQHTLEWPWHATWVCDANPAHMELATPAEEKVSGRSGDSDHE